MRNKFWIVIVILVVGYFILTRIYTTYKTEELEIPLVSCEDGELITPEWGNLVAGTNIKLTAVKTCMDYESSRYKVFCEGDKFICECEATILDQILDNALTLKR